MDMLKALFTSRTRVKLLTTFMQNPEGEYFIRELTRMLDEQINSVRRELDSLKRIGLLRSKTKNRKKFYIVNKGFVFFNELQSMIRKASSAPDEMVKQLSKLPNADLVVLSGEFVGKDSACDLLVVGNINKSELQKILDSQGGEAAPVKFTVLTKSDFLYRLQIHDKFIAEIVNDSSNIIALNKLGGVIEED